MKRILLALAITTAALAMPAFADVGISVNVGEPGFYGRLDLGDFPAPRLISRRPVIIERAPAHVVQEPLYLRVPPEHSHNWRRYCHQYDACGRQVYFVDHQWYNNVYAPRYRERHEHEFRHEEHRDDHDGRHDHDDRSDRDHEDHDHRH